MGIQSKSCPLGRGRSKASKCSSLREKGGGGGGEGRVWPRSTTPAEDGSQKDKGQVLSTGKLRPWRTLRR